MRLSSIEAKGATQLTRRAHAPDRQRLRGVQDCALIVEALHGQVPNGVRGCVQDELSALRDGPAEATSHGEITGPCAANRPVAVDHQALMPSLDQSSHALERPDRDAVIITGGQPAEIPG